MSRHYEVEPSAASVSHERAPGLWQRLVAVYASADPRSLGIFRIALGALLFVDVALKFPEVGAHLSNAGWLPNHYALFRPMGRHVFSIYFAFSSPLEVKVMLTLHLLVCVMLMVGYRTKLMQVLALVLTTSLNSRNLVIENGGTVVLNLLVLWSAFLPLGRRFSFDALRASLASRRETSATALNDRRDPPREQSPVVSLAVTALLLQWATIYLLNALHKSGASWRDGTAVHYFLQQDRLVTWFGAWLRDVLPLAAIRGLTYATLVIEGLLPLLLLSPVRSHVTRLVAFALVALLHLSIDSVLQLGSFSWAMLVAMVALLPPRAWQALNGYFRARRRATVVHFHPDSGVWLLFCRLVKRLDALDLVTFRPLDADSPKKARKTLAVSVDGEKTEAGWDALLALTDSLWFGSRPLRLLAPFCKRRVTRRLAQLGTAPEELDELLGTESLVGEADARADEPSRAQLARQRLLHGLGQVAVAGLLAACALQASFENAVIPAALKLEQRPAALEALIEYPRIFQGWSMFAPDPPLSDGRLVVDGVTRDGRRLDPLTGRAPRFEVHPADEPRTNLIWGYFHVRIAEERFRDYWNGVRDFLVHHHELTGRPQDALRSFDAYFVSETFAAPGQKRPAPERRKLFSSAAPAAEPSAPGARPKSRLGKPRAQ